MPTAELDNPVIKDGTLDTLDATDQSFLDAAAKADRGEDFSLPSAQESEHRTPDKTETTTSTNPDTTPEKKQDDRPRDELGRFTKREDGTDIPESERAPVENRDDSKKPDTQVKPDAKPDDKAESSYERAKRERERQENLLKNFEEEKRRFRAEADAERQRLAQERAQLTQRPSDQQQTKIAAKEFAEFAKKQRERATQLRAAGDYDEADKAADLAVDASAKALEASEQEAKQQYEQVAQQSREAWLWDMNQAQQREPEAHKEGSPIRKEVEFLLGNFGPVFERIPPTKMADGSVMGGFSLATEVAKLRLQAGAASGLEEKVKTLTAEVTDLRQRTGINGSGPTSQPKQRSFETMSPEEQDAYLLQQARAYDAATT